MSAAGTPERICGSKVIGRFSNRSKALLCYAVTAHLSLLAVGACSTQSERRTEHGLTNAVGNYARNMEEYADEQSSDQPPCFSVWNPYAYLQEDFRYQIAPMHGQAIFWCKPSQPSTTDTYNITWIHRNRTIYANGIAVQKYDATKGDQYVFMSDDGKSFGLGIDRVTAASVGFVQCYLESRQTPTKTENPPRTFLYVELKATDMFPQQMQRETTRVGVDAVFDCQVYFSLAKDDPCGDSVRFRWLHQGRYAYAPPNDPNKPRPSAMYDLYEDDDRNISRLSINEVQREDEGVVKCEVRWGPMPHQWVSQEARLTVI